MSFSSSSADTITFQYLLHHLLHLVLPSRHVSSPIPPLLPLISLLIVVPNGLWAQQLAHQPSSMPSNYGLQPARISRFDPILKTRSDHGFLPESARHGTFVRTGPSVHSPPLQILVEDRDLLPGMPSAVYQYILTGYGAERFAVDRQGNLYLNVDELDADSTGTPNFVLHVMAREMDTSPQRSSPPISVTIHIVGDDQITGSAPPQSIYIANVSALDPGERVIAQVKAREGEGSGSISYRIVEVSDEASSSFHYDNANHELRAIGPLYPGHQYKVVIEARDTEGLVGHAVVLVQALPPPATDPFLHHLSSTVLPPVQFASSPLPTLLPSEFWPSNYSSHPQNPFWPITTTIGAITPMHFGTTLPPPPNTAHPTEQNIFVELSEATPPGSIVTILGSEISAERVYFVLKGGNEEGKFGLDEQTGTVSTKRTFDREHGAEYQLHIESRSRAPIDQLLYVTKVHVDVLDVNDNAPQFVGSHPILLVARLDELSLNNSGLFQPNMFVGRVEVIDPDQGDNGKMQLSVMPPLDRLFSISDTGEVRVNGALSSAHLGEHQLTLRAVDRGDPPLESRAVVRVRIDGNFASSIRETLLLGGPTSMEQYHRPNSGSSGVSSSSIPSSSSDYEFGTEAETGRNNKSATNLQELLLMPDNNNNNKLVPDANQQLAPFTRIDHRLGGTPLLPLLSTTILPPTTSPMGFRPRVTPPVNLAVLSAIRHLQMFSTPSPTPPPISKSSISSEELNTPRLAPIFDSAELKVFVEENEEQMELTRVRAHYPDGGPGQITYQLQTGDESVFSVDANSGRVTLLRALDAESERQPPIYRIKIGTAESAQDDLVLDPGLAHSCEMTVHVVDINDWIPNFEQQQYEFTIPETAEKGTVVGQITAYDQDLTAPNNKIRYELNSKHNSEYKPEAAHLFRIDPESGQIVLSAESVVNFAGKKLEYMAMAKDGGLEGTEQNGTTEVAILVEGKRSKGTKSREGGGRSHEKMEEEQNQQVMSTTTTTPITTTEIPAPFPARNMSKLHRPHNQRHQHNIQFVGRTFDAKVAEGQRPPVLVLTLPVTNKPRDTRFIICAIRSGNLRGAFSVVPNIRGDCELRTQTQLDRESVSGYQLNVSVQNDVQSDSAMVAVTVLDVNDNKPKFVFPPNDEPTDGDQQNNTVVGSPSSSSASTVNSYFAVLPLETLANEKFFGVLAKDADEAESGNGAVTYELQDESQSSTAQDAALFGMDAKSGELFVRKRASEVVQLSRRDYFQVTVLACDNPVAGTNNRLCSKAPVAISLLGDQHRFGLIFAGMGADQIRRKERKISKSIRPFVGQCPQAKILKVEEQRSADEGGEQVVASAVMYLANPGERKLCQKKEFRELFSAGAKHQLAGQMRKFGAELLDILGGAEQEAGTASSRRSTGGGGGDEEDGIAALLLPLVDWGGMSTVLIIIGLSVALIVLVGLCALYAFRIRHRQMRRRTEQLRRRHRAISAGGTGLLAMRNNNNKCPRNHLGQPMFGGPVSSSFVPTSNNNLYLPATGAVVGSDCSAAGLGPFDRGANNRFYESQLLELPMGDDEYAAQVANPPTANGTASDGGQGGMARFVGQRGPMTTTTMTSCDGGGRRVARHPTATNPSNSPPQRQFSELLPPPPQTQQHHHPENSRRRYSPPPANQEGDFSIDESFYVASGQHQARCIY